MTQVQLGTSRCFDPHHLGGLTLSRCGAAPVRSNESKQKRWKAPESGHFPVQSIYLPLDDVIRLKNLGLPIGHAFSTLKGISTSTGGIPPPTVR